MKSLCSIGILFLFLASMAWGQIEIDGDSVRVTQTGKYIINTLDNTINFTSFEPMVYSFSSDTTNPVNVSGKLYKNKIGVYQTMVVATLLQQYEAYTKECYADSSKDTTYYSTHKTFCEAQDYKDKVESYAGMDRDIKIIKIKYSSPEFKFGHRYAVARIVWNHPEPTFTGFIEFLKRGVK